MLSTIYIKNFALIDELTIDFSSGFNVITGETGAGKSIIIDAFMAVLGERTSSSVVRQNEKKAIIEANFNIASESVIADFLQEKELEDNGDILILRREITATGNSRAFINDSPVNIALLKSIGDLLVDFHGQHEHQLLLNPKYHLQVLDSICGFGDLKKDWKNEYSNLKVLISKIENAKLSANQSAYNAERYSFELEEIEKINPQLNELDELEEKLKKAENVEEILSLCIGITDDLEETDNAVCSRLADVKKLFEKLIYFESSFSDYSTDLDSAIISLGEISHAIMNYKDNLSFDSDELEHLRSRVFELNGLRKKYGSYDAVFERIDFLKAELNTINNYTTIIDDLNKSINASQKHLYRIGKSISEIRHKKSIDLSEQLLTLLGQLGMTSANFKVDFGLNYEQVDNGTGKMLAFSEDEQKYYAAFSNGIDKVQFMISANKGEPLRPLKDIVSGGEISRIMLALKAIIAEHEEMPMLVFDEIDTGISGKTALQTGLMMKKIASRHQVVAITHLPQIAALGDENLFVSKAEDKQRTHTSIKQLSETEKIREIAQMISGNEITEVSLKYASDLIANKKLYPDS